MESPQEQSPNEVADMPVAKVAEVLQFSISKSSDAQSGSV